MQSSRLYGREKGEEARDSWNHVYTIFLDGNCMADYHKGSHPVTHESSLMKEQQNLDNDLLAALGGSLQILLLGTLRVQA